MTWEIFYLCLLAFGNVQHFDAHRSTYNCRSMYIVKSILDKSVVLTWVGSPAQSQMSLFLEYQYPFPQKSVVMSLKKKNMAVAVTRDFFSLVKIGGPLFVSCAKCI